MNTEKIELINSVCFKKGYLPNESFNAWTKYEVDEEDLYYSLEVILNRHFYKFPESKMLDIIIHELTHCSFYCMHADGILTDDEVIFLNEMLDDGRETIFYTT